jgi:hypothetical protein
VYILCSITGEGNSGPPRTLGGGWYGFNPVVSPVPDVKLGEELPMLKKEHVILMLIESDKGPADPDSQWMNNVNRRTEMLMFHVMNKLIRAVELVRYD